MPRQAGPADPVASVHEDEVMFDLSTVAASDTAEMEFRHPITNEKTGWKITIAGPGHPVTMDISKRLQRERLQRDKAIERARANGSKWKGDDSDPDEERQRNAQNVSVRILGWSEVHFDGKPFTYSKDAALALMLEPKFVHVQNQIIDFLNSEASFTTSSART